VSAELRSRPADWSFACPCCRAPLEPAGEEALRCPGEGTTFRRVDGVWRFLTPERERYFAPFLRDYAAIRRAEGYGYDDPQRYRRLPEAAPDDPLAWQWRMRAQSFAALRRHVLAPMDRIHEGARSHTNVSYARDVHDGALFAPHSPAPSPTMGGRGADSPPLPAWDRGVGGEGARRSEWIEPGPRALDLGAGVGWLSNRLTRLGCAPCAVDLNLDQRDGLRAARHYAAAWPALQAEFDRLPLADTQADLVIYNASLHYSADYRATLAEALRVLRPGGRLVVMDSPIYRHEASGRRMIAERQAAFARDHGTRSDALPSVGYLTWAMLRELGRELGLRWRVFRPWYGWRWALRPWRARLLSQREPSTFALLVACRISEVRAQIPVPLK
jgi:SAM-dependent methyltransferase